MKDYIVLEDLKRFIYTLGDNKKTMFFSFLVAGILGLIVAFTVAPTYTSKGIYEVTLEDLDTKSQLSAFRQDIFNPFGAMGDPASYKVIEILKSRDFIINLIKKYNLKRDLYAVSEYNKSTRQTTYSTTVDENGKWIKGIEPDDESAYELFKVFYNTSLDLETGYITISVKHYSQVTSKKWVEILAYEVNELLRNEDLESSKASIEYYKNQISQELSEDLINVTSRLMEGEIRKKMLANVKSDYAIKPIDPPYFPELKSGPSRLLILLLFLFLGFLTGSAIIYNKKIKNKFRELAKRPEDA